MPHRLSQVNILPDHASPLQTESWRLWPKPTMPACAAGHASGCSGPSWRAGCGWWSPPWPLGWGWTDQTCGRCCTWGCPRASRATCRPWAAPGVTGSLHTATSSCSPRLVPTPLEHPTPRPAQHHGRASTVVLQGEDLWELRRHVHARAADFLALKKLVQRVFPPCACPRQLSGQEGGESQAKHSASAFATESSREDKQPGGEHTVRCPGHRRALPVQPTVQALDLPEEGERRGQEFGEHPVTHVH